MLWFRKWLVAWSTPSHNLHHCWNIVNWTLRNKLDWNCNRNSCIFFTENAFENAVCKMAAILSRPRTRTESANSRPVRTYRGMFSLASCEWVQSLDLGNAYKRWHLTYNRTRDLLVLTLKLNDVSTFEFWDSVRLILEVLRYVVYNVPSGLRKSSTPIKQRDKYTFKTIQYIRFLQQTPPQRDGNTENVSMLWRHHGVRKSLSALMVIFDSLPHIGKFFHVTGLCVFGESIRGANHWWCRHNLVMFCVCVTGLIWGKLLVTSPFLRSRNATVMVPVCCIHYSDIIMSAMVSQITGVRLLT